MASCGHGRLWWVGTALVCAVVLGPTSRAVAFSHGIRTLNFGAQGCNECHSGGQDPTVTLTGPSPVDPGSTNEYTLRISTVGSQTFGGLNVSAPFGTLDTGGSNAEQTQTIQGTGDRDEITHTSRKAAAGGSTTFSFLWTAPASFTSVALNGWGNAVNGDATPFGDRAAFSSLTVVSSSPGPNPTATATPTPIPPPMHDSVVAQVKPVNVTIAAGASSVTKAVSVKVTNADAKTDTGGHTIQLAAVSDCPAGVTIAAPDFGSGAGAVLLAGGKAKSAKVVVTVSADAFTTLNGKAANRCTLTFAASSPGSLDPTPTNNVVTAELNVTDKNDPAQVTVDESFIQSLTPVTLIIPKGGASKAKTVKPAVGNADILPAPEKPGDTITVGVSNGDCPAEIFGPVTPAQVTVKGGSKQAVSLAVTASTAFATAGVKSPARCTALVNATGPADPDPDPTNNTTRLVIDVIDNNDF